MIKPDYEKAALKATELLIKYNIDSAPIDPLPIFKHMTGALVFSFSEVCNTIGFERDNMVTLFGLENQDAVTSVHMVNGKLRYLIAYNQQLPFFLIQKGLARELGHIVLGHDGSIPEEVATEEAKCFSKHLICPRPLISALQENGIKLTIEAVGCITGCYGRCMKRIRGLPGVHVPPEMNRQVKEQFADYVRNFSAYQAVLVSRDESPIADFGTYMDGYEE